MIRRLAAWYGTDGWGLAARGAAVGGLAVFMAAWMIIDHGSVERAAVAAAGVIVAALSPLAIRHGRPRAWALLLSFFVLSVGFGLNFFAMSQDLALSVWCGAGIGLAWRVRAWEYDRYAGTT